MQRATIFGQMLASQLVLGKFESGSEIGVMGPGVAQSRKLSPKPAGSLSFDRLGHEPCEEANIVGLGREVCIQGKVFDNSPRAWPSDLCY